MTATVALVLVCMLCRCFYHWAFTMIPATLWMAWVLSTWQTDGSFVTASSQISQESRVLANGKAAEGDSTDGDRPPADSNDKADGHVAIAPAKLRNTSAGGSRRWQGPRTVWGGPRIFTASQVPYLSPVARHSSSVISGVCSIPLALHPSLLILL